MLVNVILLIKLKENPICWKIGLERSPFVRKLGSCTQPTIFISFTLGQAMKIKLWDNGGWLFDRREVVVEDERKITYCPSLSCHPCIAPLSIRSLTSLRLPLNRNI